MGILGGLLFTGGSIVCCGLLFVGVMVALVVWYWKNQPNQQVSATPPTPPVQATIEHPTVASTNMPAPQPIDFSAPTPAAPTAPEIPAPEKPEVTTPEPTASESPASSDGNSPSADA